MRKLIIPAMLASTLALSGCAAGMGGDPLAGILGSVLGGGNASPQGNLSEFERAAVNACGQEASRYGRVQINQARQVNREIVRVDGRVQTNDGYERAFACAFRNDGRIVDFNI